MIKIITSWDDYSAENIHLAELLLRYKLPGIFFIECGGSEEVKQIKKIAKMGFEIGSHTFSHPEDLKQLSSMDLIKEINQSREFLKKETGQDIDWFCYPGGRFNEEVKAHVKVAGYKFARTTNITMPEKFDPLAVYTDLHIYPNRKEYRGEDWLEYGKKVITAQAENIKKPEVHVWGHAWEITKFGNWEKVEKLLKFLSEL